MNGLPAARPTRRLFLGAAGAAAALLVASAVPGQQVFKDIDALQPGEFTWHPERSPDGPVAIVVSIDEQRVHVYRNGVRIAVSTCSTGRPGHATPTGVFVVLQKDADHRSSTYNNAPMPNMNRLTWDGIALHAGNLPGYPASHGCVRLPLEFSALLFTVTHLGTPVIIADAHHAPLDLVHPGLLLDNLSEADMETAVRALSGRKHPSDWSLDDIHPIVTMLVSSFDSRAVLIENDRQIAEAPLMATPGVLGDHVFVLHAAGEAALRWGVLTYGDAAPEAELAVLERVALSPEFKRLVRFHAHPGMILVLTDLPLHPDRRSKRDFVIMNG